MHRSNFLTENKSAGPGPISRLGSPPLDGPEIDELGEEIQLKTRTRKVFESQTIMLLKNVMWIRVRENWKTLATIFPERAKQTGPEELR